jgi:Flp pilus assembly protein protease CpaA
MEVVTILLIWAGILLAIGTYSDIRWREVPDWSNYAGVAVGLGTRLMASIALSDWHYIIAGLLGFGAAAIFSLVMFRLGQWGGGDSKILMALGALLGLELSFSSNGIAFITNTLIGGAVYGVLWTLGIAAFNFRRFSATFMQLAKQGHAGIVFVIALGLGLTVSASTFMLPLGSGFFFIGMTIPALFVIALVIKAVEDGCMLKKVRPAKLTEGDWIAKDIRVRGKKFAGPDDLGISLWKIKRLKDLAKHHIVRYVTVKEGMPFVPSFALGFVLMLSVGNVMLWMLRMMH